MSRIRNTVVAVAMLALLDTSMGFGDTAKENAAKAYQSGRDATDIKVRRTHFVHGMKLAREILSRDQTSAEGLFWLAVNMGAEAIDRGKMAALPVVPEMEKLLLKAFQADPKYEHGGAARVLGRLYHQAPAVISVGSDDKARIYLKAALDIAPEHPGNLAFSADFLLDIDDKEKAARKLAEKCIAVLDKQDFGSDETEWRAIAQEVIEDTD
ncbi:MAG: TRAP transporter TatT component family protein [Deltaproteobacteria bacterium]|nr:TRAP transporter TatT component family protein [Deltaproteobacteria bacterium]